MRALFYRSDARHPTLLDHDGYGKIFSNGFTKRDAKYADPRLRFPPDGAKLSPDIVPESAVCFTRDFLAAPLFPVDDLTIDSWVYVMDLDLSQVFNTQHLQWKYVIDNDLVKGKQFEDAAKVLWTMFGQERATNYVSASDIVAAIKVQREFTNPTNPLNGGYFLCLEYMSNPDYKYKGKDSPEDIPTVVRNILEPFVLDKTWNKMPSFKEGIVRSEPHTISEEVDISFSSSKGNCCSLL